jgi:hypothetical protein
VVVAVAVAQRDKEEHPALFIVSCAAAFTPPFFYLLFVF